MENFKVYKKRAFSFVDGFQEIRGPNSIGKSTIVDAFYWGLTGFNQNGEKIEAVHAPNGVKAEEPTFVSLTFEVDGKEERITRMIKKKGEDSESYETIFFKDSLDEIKKKDFDKIVERLLGGNLENFKLCNNPKYFDSLTMKKKREVLLSMFGDFDETKIIDANKDLLPLKDILKKENCSADELFEKVESECKGLEAEITKQEAAIKELEEQIKEGESTLITLEEKKSVLETELKISVGTIDEDIKTLRDKHITEIEGLREKLSSVWDDLNSNPEVKEKQKRKVFLENEISSLERQILQLKYKKKNLAESHKERTSEEFSTDATCKYCGALIPEEKIQRLSEEFAKKKETDLQNIIKEGKTLKERINASEINLTNLMEEKKKIDDFFQEEEESKSTVSEKYHQMKKEIDEKEKTFRQNKECLLELKGEREAKAEKTIKELKEVENKIIVAKSVSELGGRISNKKTTIEEIRKTKAEKEEVRNLLKTFNENKINDLKDKLDSKFKIADIRMFDKLVDGRIKETCEPMFHGQSFKQMSSAEKINVSLDICLGLSKHFEIEAPIFIDEGESIINFAVDFLSDKQQIIKLSVADQDTMTVKRG